MMLNTPATTCMHLPEIRPVSDLAELMGVKLGICAGPQIRLRRGARVALCYTGKAALQLDR